MENRRGHFKKPLLLSLIAAAAVGMALPANRIVGKPMFAAAAAEPSPVSEDELQAFAALEPIDTHVHAFKSDPAFTDLMVRLRLHVLDICVADTQGIYGELAAQLARAKGFVQASSGHAKLCVTFNPFTFQQKDFARKTVEQLHQEFAEGAVAVKIWKNIGMELKAPDGNYVMPEDPALAPIYREIAAENKTLVAHVAEPSSCWH